MRTHEDIDKHLVFGLQQSGSLTRSKEVWLRVLGSCSPDAQPAGDVEIKKSEGGLYGVTACKLKEELKSEFFKKEGYRIMEERSRLGQIKQIQVLGINA